MRIVEMLRGIDLFDIVLRGVSVRLEDLGVLGLRHRCHSRKSERSFETKKTCKFWNKAYHVNSCKLWKSTKNLNGNGKPWETETDTVSAIGSGSVSPVSLALPRCAARSFDAFLAAQVFRRRWSAEPDTMNAKQCAWQSQAGHGRTSRLYSFCYDYNMYIIYIYILYTQYIYMVPCPVFPPPPWDGGGYDAPVVVYIHTYIPTYIPTYLRTYIHTYHYNYLTLHYLTLHYLTLHSIHTYIPLPLHTITLHYITLHYLTLPYITLPYIPYIHTYIDR